MATSRELLEAAAFHRRRVVAAFLTGSAYDAPPAVLRRVVAGALVTLVAVAVTAIAGRL
ncbi:hypothetical protein [Nocardioides sp. MH1]|uniref:hypothetical protein n=1 Tax=Nocardioides sp. MH1 TaxID=3242490 RepID=UPI003520EDF2